MKVEIVDGRLRVDYEGQHMAPELYAEYMTLYARWQRTRASEGISAKGKRSGCIFDGSGRTQPDARKKQESD